MSRNRKVFLTTVLILLISIWHYQTGVHHTFLHILHRELYLFPIALAAFWFGARGGVTVALISILLFLPRTLMGGHQASIYDLNNFLSIPTFLLVGYLVGKYQDIRKARYTRLWEHGNHDSTAIGRNNILLCIDNSKNAYKAALFVADNFSDNPRVAVNIVGFIRDPSADYFSSREEYIKTKGDIEASITKLVENSRDTFLKRGFPPDAVTTGIQRLQKESIVAEIIEEQKKSQSGVIVVGGTKMSKTEEFILGNKAVKLVREADCPVITVF